MFRLTVHNHGGFSPGDDDRRFAGSRVRVGVYAARLAVQEATDVVFQRPVVPNSRVELVVGGRGLVLRVFYAGYERKECVFGGDERGKDRM